MIIPVVGAVGALAESFKHLPGHERHYVPRSEYLFKVLQPGLDDLLFLGKSYEASFDRFEMFFALVYADLAGRDWGPPGRFAWKHSNRGHDASPFVELLDEATTGGPTWTPSKAGLFGGSLDRFQNAAQQYLELLNKLSWW